MTNTAITSFGYVRSHWRRSPFLNRQQQQQKQRPIHIFHNYHYHGRSTVSHKQAISLLLSLSTTTSSSFISSLLPINSLSFSSRSEPSVLDTTSKSSPLSFTYTSNRDKTLLLGCACYDPSVYDIWTGIQRHLNNNNNNNNNNFLLDIVFFTNYQAQIHALLHGHIDVAWNGPIAHVMTEQQIQIENNNNNNNTSQNHESKTTKREVISLGMRDVDCDFESTIIVLKSQAHCINSWDDLQNCHIITGTSDSPQAHVVPLYYIQSQQQKNDNSIGETLNVTPMEFDIGLHGDTAVGEIKALEILLSSSPNNSSSPTVVVCSKMMWNRAITGQLPSINSKQMQDTCQEVTVHTPALQLPTFDHCVFNAIIDSNHTDNDQHMRKLQQFGQALLSMSWDNPIEQELMKLEGIKRNWSLPRQSGYDIMRQAVLSGQGISIQQQKQHQSARNFIYHEQRRSYYTQPKQ